MGRKAGPDVSEAHRQFAVDLFNRVWELLEKEDRTPEEAEELVHAAHASRYHWSQVGEPLNLAIGDWQISRVYATLGRGEPAVHHARRCLEIVEGNGIQGFHLASAYEGMARALSAAQRKEECARYIERAREEAAKVKDVEERETVLNQLRDIPEYWD